MKLVLHPTKVRVRNLKKDIETNRQNYIGGSDIGTILGLNEYKSEYTLWSEKVGLTEPENIDDKESVWWGSNTEELIAKRFCMKTGKRVKKSNYAYGLAEYPFIRAHVDRLIIGENAGLECKATDVWKYNYEAGEVPPAHYSQTQFYMAVTGRKNWYLATHRGNGNFHINSIARNDEFIEQMLDAITDFWNHVVSGTPVPVDGSDSTRETIEKQFPDSSAEAETVNLNEQEGTLVALLALKKQEQSLKELKNQYQSEIKLALGEAERGESDQFYVSWKSNSKGSRVFRFLEKPV